MPKSITNPEILYHYTTMSALFSMFSELDGPNTRKRILKGITDNDEDKTFSGYDGYILTLWATHIQYMNDPTEFEFFCRSFSEFAHTSMLGHKHSLLSPSKIESEIKSIPEVPYILSFSENRDDLSMWRGYGGNGCGVAIGFNAKKLQEYFAVYDTSIHMEPVNYITQTELEDEIRAEKCSQITLDKMEYNGRVITYKYFIHKFAAKVKDKSYADENEWRIYKHSSNPSWFRERNNVLYPYMEIRLPVSLIEEILIGPCIDRRLSQNSINLLLERQLNGGVPSDHFKPYINISDIPYIIR